MFIYKKGFQKKFFKSTRTLENEKPCLKEYRSEDHVKVIAYCLPLLDRADLISLKRVVFSIFLLFSLL